MTILLRKMRTSDRTLVEKFVVKGSQAAFIEPPSETLAAPNQRESFVIEKDGIVAGFFQVDSSSGSQCVINHLELHEVLIDQSKQGKGYGKAFVNALPQFLQREYCGWQGVCLTVNCKNEHAKRLYELGGFTDTGDLKQEGRSGPQHIMRRTLP